MEVWFNTFPFLWWWDNFVFNSYRIFKNFGLSRTSATHSKKTCSRGNPRRAVNDSTLNKDIILYQEFLRQNQTIVHKYGSHNLKKGKRNRRSNILSVIKKVKNYDLNTINFKTGNRKYFNSSVNCVILLVGDCYVSQTMSETNPNNLIISILDGGKGCYSLP
jgi:hypothetical protein